LKPGAFQLWAAMGQGESPCTAPPRRRVIHHLHRREVLSAEVEDVALLWGRRVTPVTAAAVSLSIPVSISVSTPNPIPASASALVVRCRYLHFRGNERHGSVAGTEDDNCELPPGAGVPLHHHPRVQARGAAPHVDLILKATFETRQSREVLHPGSSFLDLMRQEKNTFQDQGLKP
jgi:hypothetical protein